MTRGRVRLLVIAAMFAGVVVGGLTMLVLTTPQATNRSSAGADTVASSTVEPSPTPVSDPTPATSTPTPVPGSTGTEGVDPGGEGADTSPGPPDNTLLVWTAGGLPEGLVEVVAADPDVYGHTVVLSRPAGLVEVTDADGQTVQTFSDGWYIPLDVIAMDPGTFPIFSMGLDQKALADLRPGQAILSRSSAGLRGVGPGARLTLLGGGEVTVAAVVDDLHVAGAEVVVHVEDAAALGVDRPRYVLLVYDGARSAVQQRLAAAVGDRTPVRFRSPAETTWLRHGDAVLPQVLIKQALGEFAVRQRAGRRLEIDPEWEAANIGTADVPILGTVRCHRMVLPRLIAAMEELELANLAPLVNASNFAGCYAPRLIAPGATVSRHSWGAAVDLNVGANPRGSFSTQDPRLVEVMRRHGFTWGGTWLVPDPAHYELVVTS